MNGTCVADSPSEVFNLLKEPWVPVVFLNGQFARLGLNDVFTQAQKIRDIASSNPMDRFAMVRFLLAIRYWSLGNPPAAATQSANVDQERDIILQKLNEYSQCFNLFGDQRFYQTQESQRSTKIGELFQEIPSGNNFRHFRHVTDYQHGFCPACCAMGLLRLPLFAVSGLPDLKCGINGPPPIYVINLGSTLADTLIKNWLPRTEEDLGTPAWENPLVRPTQPGRVPLLVGLTTLARKVWLYDEDDKDNGGTCTLCGLNTPRLIKQAYISSAGDLKNDNWEDPHVIYREKKPGERTIIRAPDLTKSGNFQMDRPSWDLMAALSPKAGQRLLVVAFATDKAKNIDVWERRLVLPKQSPSDCYLAWVSKLRNILRDTAGRGSSSRKKQKDFVEIMTSLGRPDVEHRVAEKLLSLAEKNADAGQDAWQDACQAYGVLGGILGRSLAPGVTSRALHKRRDLSSALPEIRCQKSTSRPTNERSLI